MEVVLTPTWEGFINQLVETGRYHSAADVVQAALSELQEREGEIFPPGSLLHLYGHEHQQAETQLARKIHLPRPDEVSLAARQPSGRGWRGRC